MGVNRKPPFEPPDDDDDPDDEEEEEGKVDMRRDRGVGRLDDEARRSNVCLKGDIRDLNVAMLANQAIMRSAWGLFFYIVSKRAWLSLLERSVELNDVICSLRSARLGLLARGTGGRFGFAGPA